MATADTTIRITAVDATKRAFDSVNKNLKEIDGALSGLRGGFAGLAVVAAAGVGIAFVKNSINAIAALDDLSEKTGLTVEFLSQLEGVATIGGHSLDALSSSAAKLTKSIGEAQTGNKEILRAFEAIGISVEDLRSKKPDALFLDVATKLAKTEDAALAAAVSTKILGRSAQEQLPFLKDLAEQGLGNVRVTTAQAAAAEKLQKEYGKLKLETIDLGTALAIELLPGLNRILGAMADAVRVAGGLGAGFGLLKDLPLSAFERFSIGISGDLSPAVTRLTKDLEDLRVQLTRLDNNQEANADRGSINASIERKSKQLELLDKIQRREVERDFVGPIQQQIGFKIDASKLNEDGKKAQDALSKLFEQRAKQTSAAESSLASERLKILEQFHAQGLIAESEYWDSRFDIQREATNKELAEIDVEIANRRKSIRDQFSGADAGPDVTKFSAERINAEKEIEAALERRAIAERKLGSFSLENQLSRRKAELDFSDTISEIAAKRLEIEDRSAEALAIRQEKQNRALRTQLTTDKDTAGLNQLKRLEAAEAAQLRFNEVQQKGADITARLALEEERIQNAQRVGAIGELDALRQTGDARIATVAQMKAISAELDEIASKPGLEKLRLQADQFKASMVTLAVQADLLKQKFETIGVDAFATALTDLASGTKSVKDAFKDMANSIVSEIQRIIAQDFAKRLLGAGGLNVGGLLASLFGGAGGAAAGGGIEGTAAFGAGFATGGSFTVGGSGGTDTTPVAFRATPGERVTVETPSQQKRQPTLSIVNNFSVQGTTDQSSQQQIADRVARSVMAASRRNS